MNRKLDSPTNLRKNFRKSIKNKSKITKESQDLFDDKYLVKKNKFQEQEIISKTKPFCPGKIYMFDYNPIDKKILPFYDRKPIILALGGVKTDKGFLEYGLNLSFIPEKVKTFIIDTIFKLSYRNIQKDYNKVLDNKGVSNLKNLGISKKQIDKLFKNTGYEFAIRSYYRHRSNDTRVIFYDDWYLISYIRSKSVRNKTIGEIQRLYQITKKLKK